MQLSVKGLACALSIVWGGLAMFLVGVCNLIWTGYGDAFLKTMASVYPGYDARASIAQVLVGTLWGLVDGAIAGALLAWLYNRAASGGAAHS